MRSKWVVKLLLALAAPAMAQTPAEPGEPAPAPVPVSFTAVASHTGSALDESRFPLTGNGFRRRADTLSLSADGETAGWSWRVRGLLAHDPQGGTSRQLRLKELNRVWQLSDGCYLSAGKRILAWDVGFLAQPVGFFQTQVVLNDLEDVAGNSEGLPLLMYSCSLGHGLALDAVRSDDLGRRYDYQNLGLHQSVVRLSGHAGQSSFALLARRVSGQGQGWGATWSAVPDDALELHASLYSHKGKTRLLHRGLWEAPAFWRTDPYQVVRDPHYRTQVLLGATWTPRNLPVVTLEFSHDDAGLNGAQWQRWRDLVDLHRDPRSALPPAAREGNLLWDLATIRQQGTRRNYAFLQLQNSLLGLNYAFGNEFGLDDRSYAAFVSTRVNLARKLFATASYSYFSHREGTEFAYLPVRSAFTVRLVASF